MLNCFCAEGYEGRARGGGSWCHSNAKVALNTSHRFPTHGRYRRLHPRWRSGSICSPPAAPSGSAPSATIGGPCGCRVWPRVAAVVPARNEAETIAESIGSLLRQDYPGAWTVILVDDDSSDGTAGIAQGVATANGGEDRLRVVTSRGLPAGWTGKLWAFKQGIDAAAALAAAARLSAAHRCRHRARPRFRRAGWSAHAEPQRLGADVADGEAALREPRRARQRPGLHLLLPDALSVSLGEPARQHRGGGRRRLHAGARRYAAQGRRHRGHPRRPDRRLRAWRRRSRRMDRSGSA